MNRGDWIQTYTGKKFHPLDPQPGDICIEDIAHALSMNCRFAGHCKKFYSVAEHSLNVSCYVPTKYGLEALLHDASEAYLQDIPRPIKPMLSNYKEIESNLEHIISLRFDLDCPLPKEVKEIDNRILGDEKDLLMSEEPAPWTLFGERLGIKEFNCFTPDKAEESFLEAFYKIIESR